MVAAMALFGVLDANSKLLAGTYPASQVVALRYATLLLVLFAARAAVPGAGGTLSTAHPFLHLARATCMLGSGLGFFLALREIPLAEGYLVYFTAPFLTLGLAALVLKERTGPAVWWWSFLGFAGVLLAMWPGLAAGGPVGAYLWALLGTACYAAVLTINRLLRHETGAAVLILWSSLPGLIVLFPFAAMEWVAPGPRDLLALMANGLFAGAATLCLAIAFRHDSAARLAPLEFSALIFAVGFDLLIWNVWPSGWTLGGAVIVVFACLMSQRAASSAARP
ncbi:DMT family transporter [Roseomonas sp. PWR1]|uniref:DMT family transporter n=1 Tax=Roseomonas nitratireducens TaxID=2820810 RepID=A0ABS4AUQ0_9PROT|nr:DMT family transporter [Neoroseomonas nitratireducens]